MKEKEERCCGNCCWFYGEMTDGDGFCAEAKDTFSDYTNCSKPCHVLIEGKVGHYAFVPHREMRHHMAVLLQYHRADEDMNYRFPGGDSLEEAVVFAYKYMKVFSKL